MDGVRAGKSADKWLRARQRLLWRQAVWEPLEPQLPLTGTQVGGLMLEARLGTGGYGTVYRAQSPGGKSYAVKFIHLPRAATWAWRELEVLLRLRRLGWVAVRGHGEWPEKAPRFVYLVMEYVQGVSLHTWAGRHNPTARRVVEVVRALARQLAAVHRAGVVHRDVKCANVVVREKDGRPVLVDFGLGTFPGAHPVTGPRVPGTAPYRSPEAESHRHEQGRYEAHACDDLWALGVVLYWLLTGTFPFQVEETGDSLADARALGNAIVHQPPEPPRCATRACPRHSRPCACACWRSSPRRATRTRRRWRPRSGQRWPRRTRPGTCPCARRMARTPPPPRRRRSWRTRRRRRGGGGWRPMSGATRCAASPSPPRSPPPWNRPPVRRRLARTRCLPGTPRPSCQHPPPAHPPSSRRAHGAFPGGGAPPRAWGWCWASPSGSPTVPPPAPQPKRPG